MPKYNTLDELTVSELPIHVEFPQDYFPKGIGPGSFDPQLMYLHALACQQGMIHTIEQKSWVLIWLLDHVDWDNVKHTHQTAMREELKNVQS